MGRIVLAFFIACLALPGRAEPVLPGHETEILRSTVLARMSQDALHSGDRPTAIILALRGLPEAPSEADIDLFSDAYGALLRAVASRAMRLPLKVEVVATFGPRGRRILTVGGVAFDPERPDEAEPLRLWDTQSGRKIADLLPIEDTHAWGATGTPAVFSPDGRLVAAIAVRAGDVVFYEAQTGRELRRFRPYGTDGYRYSSGLVFSGDGSHVVTSASAPGAIDVWDVATGNRVFTETGDAGCVYVPIQGAAGADVFFFKAGLNAYFDTGLESICGGRLDLVRVRNGVAETLMTLPGFDSSDTLGASHLDPTGTRLMLVTATGTHYVIGLDGTVISELSPARIGGGYFIFARNGEAISAPERMWDPMPRNIRLFDLQGNPLDPTVEDHLPFLNGIFNIEGQVMGGSYELHSRTIHELGSSAAKDLPRGKALYDLVWQNLPEHVRQQVDADRVKRP